MLRLQEGGVKGDFHKNFQTFFEQSLFTPTYCFLHFLVKNFASVIPFRSKLNLLRFSIEQIKKKHKDNLLHEKA